MTEAILHGVILAFGLIIPLGVQNVFIFNQGAVQPTLLRALPVVITASICDTLLILLAVLGVSILLLTVSWIKMILFSLGFLFLLYMGWNIWNSQPSKEESSDIKRFSVKKQILFAASVSLLNPHAILDTIGVIGTNSMAYSGEEKWAFTSATIAVSWAWFFGLAIAGKSIGKLDQDGALMRRINKVSALIIWGIAVYIGWTVFGLSLY